MAADDKRVSKTVAEKEINRIEFLLSKTNHFTPFPPSIHHYSAPVSRTSGLGDAANRFAGRAVGGSGWVIFWVSGWVGRG